MTNKLTLKPLRSSTSLPLNLVEIVASELRGSRKNKFLASVDGINQSLKIGGWVPGVSRKANTGFYQGCGIRIERNATHRSALSELTFSLHYGHPVQDVAACMGLLTDKEMKKHTHQFVEAWVRLCNEKDAAIKFLNSLRPLPVYTEIGLSPKVTKTLTEVNLKLDLSTVKVPEIDSYLRPALNKDGTPKMNHQGEAVMEVVYFIRWPKDTAHLMSRFSSRHHTHCEACGKAIPSGRFVPVQAKDQGMNRHVSLWVGSDCAKNIFGIKDNGIHNGLVLTEVPNE